MTPTGLLLVLLALLLALLLGRREGLPDLSLRSYPHAACRKLYSWQQTDWVRNRMKSLGCVMGQATGQVIDGERTLMDYRHGTYVPSMGKTMRELYAGVRYGGRPYAPSP